MVLATESKPASGSRTNKVTIWHSKTFSLPATTRIYKSCSSKTSVPTRIHMDGPFSGKKNEPNLMLTRFRSSLETQKGTGVFLAPRSISFYLSLEGQAGCVSHCACSTRESATARCTSTGDHLSALSES